MHSTLRGGNNSYVAWLSAGGLEAGYAVNTGAKDLNYFFSKQEMARAGDSDALNVEITDSEYGVARPAETRVFSRGWPGWLLVVFQCDVVHMTNGIIYQGRPGQQLVSSRNIWNGVDGKLHKCAIGCDETRENGPSFAVTPVTCPTIAVIRSLVNRPNVHDIPYHRHWVLSSTGEWFPEVLLSANDPCQISVGFTVNQYTAPQNRVRFQFCPSNAVECE